MKTPSRDSATYYFVYVIQCRDGSLYTGITNNIALRMEAHRSGKGSKYVRSRLPFQLVYSEEHATKQSAAKREVEIKGWTRPEKLARLNLKIMQNVS